MTSTENKHRSERESGERQLQTWVMATLALAGAQAHAVCTFGSSSEPSLQSNLDSLLGAGTLTTRSSATARAMALIGLAGVSRRTA